MTIYRTEYDAQREYEDAVISDCTTRCEWMSLAQTQYARDAGAFDTERAWILSPFDCWYANPHYTGEPQPHPEDDSLPVKAAEGTYPDNDGYDGCPF